VIPKGTRGQGGRIKDKGKRRKEIGYRKEEIGWKKDLKCLKAMLIKSLENRPLDP